MTDHPQQGTKESSLSHEKTSAQEEEQRRFFEDCAARYDRRFMRSTWPRNQQLKARVIAESLGESVEKGRFVELGCGTAQIAEELLRRHPSARYVGLDLSPGMVRLARRRLERFGNRAEVRPVRGQLPLEPLAFTGAFGVDVLHHVDDPTRVLTELRACLRPGAPIVFLEGNPRFPLTALIGLIQREERGLFKMTFANLRQWFQAAGLEEVSVEYGPLYTPPGPRTVISVLDAIDRGAAALPLIRSLAIFYTARGQAPD